MHSSSHAASAAPPRRPPRRWKSTSTAASDLFSVDEIISEVDVFCPRVPCRTKSCEELEAELLGFEDDDDDHHHEQGAKNNDAAIPTSIDLSQLAQNLRQVQLEEGDMMWDELEDSDHDNDDDNNNRPRRGMLGGPTHSFLSVGSSMTAQQQREPGRFVTPASSFYNNNGNATTNAAPMDLTCAGVQPVERVTVDPYQFMTADMSFRLPLVGSLCDDQFVVHKSKSSLNYDVDEDLKKPSGRKTIQLDDAAMPSISLDDDDDDDAPQQQAEAPPPKPIMFGKIKRESRRLVRPNLPF